MRRRLVVPVAGFPPSPEGGGSDHRKWSGVGLTGIAANVEALSPPPGPLSRADLPPPGGGDCRAWSQQFASSHHLYGASSARCFAISRSQRSPLASRRSLS